MLEFLIFGDVVLAIVIVMIICGIAGSRRDRVEQTDMDHRVVPFEKAKASARRVMPAAAPAGPRIFPAE